jgi:hypothetical protein
MGIYLAFYPSSFDWSSGRVSHQLCVMSCENGDTVEPRCVTDLCSTKEDLIWANGNLPFT